MWIDAHAHLYDSDALELDTIARRARQAGVEFILNTGTSIATSERVLLQCAKQSLLKAAIGISPFDALSLPMDWQDSLERMLTSPSVIALGEIGIDSTNPTYPNIIAQTNLFEKQLRIAVKHGVPVIIHSRGIEQKACEICISAGVKKAVFHCFTGEITALGKILDAGYFVSFSGIITFKNSSVVKCVEYAPLSQMLIETDSPYLAPVPHRGKPNEPAWVSLVGEKVSEIKKISAGSVSDALNNNFELLFEIPRVGHLVRNEQEHSKLKQAQL